MAALDDIRSLAHLLWLHAWPEEQARQDVEAFEQSLAQWWAENPSHVAFIATLDDGAAIGIAWLVLTARVPRPGDSARCSADLQSVFVLEEQRGHGTGSALIETAIAHAFDAGAERVTVHSGRKAVPVYERLGFESARELLQKSHPSR